jgi:cytochrome c553
MGMLMSFCRISWGAALALTMALGMAPSAMAADLAAGKKKAAQCTVCHGKDGIAVNPDAPNLAGEAAGYIERQLKAFKSGARQHEIMSIVAQALSDEDIADLAAWYSAMKVTVQVPEVK